MSDVIRKIEEDEYEYEYSDYSDNEEEQQEHYEVVQKKDNKYFQHANLSDIRENYILSIFYSHFG